MQSITEASDLNEGEKKKETKVRSQELYFGFVKCT